MENLLRLTFVSALALMAATLSAAQTEFTGFAGLNGRINVRATDSKFVPSTADHTGRWVSPTLVVSLGRKDK